MIWLKWSLVVLVGLGLLWAGMAGYGKWRWQGRTEALFAELTAATRPLQPTRYDPREIEGLPAPVQRYFRAALSPGQPMVASADIAHRGSFNMGEVEDRWKRFSSVQRVTTARPGFVWDASVAMMPGLPVRVHDAYISGQGLLVPSIMGLFPLMELRGGGDIAEGELMRYLAEAAWYPTALLPSQGVAWTEIDDSSARATLRDGAVTVDLTFRFGADGLIASVRSEKRGRMVAGTSVPTPWEGRWTDYMQKDGMRVPMAGEVAWILPDSDKPYWRGMITALDYDFVE